MTLPGVGVSILPKLACPACWPAYAALLSSIGLGFLISTVSLLPMTVVLLSLALGAIAFRGTDDDMSATIGFMTWEPIPVSQRIGTRLVSTA